MTSWRCHERCAELLGISGAVARFVDRLIDRELDEVLREEGAGVTTPCAACSHRLLRPLAG